MKLGKDNGLRHQVRKTTYPLPKISITNNTIDSEKAYAKFGLALQNEICEIIKQAAQLPTAFQQRATQINHPEPDTTPTGATSNGRVKPRKVGFTDPIHDTDINHHLSALAVDTGTPSLTGRSSRSTQDSRKQWQPTNLLTVDTGSTSSTG